MSAQWYLYKDGWQQGPFSREELDKKFEAGAFGPADLVWTEGMENWARADQIEGLFAETPPPLAQFPTPPVSSAPTYQPQRQARHQAGPAPRSGKGGLVVLIVLLALLVVGGGFLAFNIFLANGDDVALPVADVELENGDSGQEMGPGDPAGADVSGLWAPPVEALPQLLEVLPKAGEVPYPLYPGARSYSYQKPQETGAAEGPWANIAYIFLLSSDPMDEVYTFYQGHLGHLDGWQTREDTDSFVLWQGSEDDYMDAWGYLIPAVIITAPWGSGLDFMPDAQSQIIVVFEMN